MPALTIGLTGGVASGKSLVGSLFLGMGVPVLDADEVARAVVEPGTEGLQQVVQRFGPSVLLPDGRLDRRQLRAIVFADTAARQDLERITHPAIRGELLRWRNAQQAPYCILVVAILVEASMQNLVDRILVVDVPEDLQMQRLQQRDGIDAGLARQMLAAQTSRAARRAAADDVLENTGSTEDLAAAVGQLHAFYTALAAKGDARAPGLCLPQRRA